MLEDAAQPGTRTTPVPESGCGRAAVPRAVRPAPLVGAAAVRSGVVDVDVQDGAVAVVCRAVLVAAVAGGQPQAAGRARFASASPPPVAATNRHRRCVVTAASPGRPDQSTR